MRGMKGKRMFIFSGFFLLLETVYLAIKGNFNMEAELKLLLIVYVEMGVVVSFILSRQLEIYTAC